MATKMTFSDSVRPDLELPPLPSSLSVKNSLLPEIQPTYRPLRMSGFGEISPKKKKGKLLLHEWIGLLQMKLGYYFVKKIFREINLLFSLNNVMMCVCSASVQVLPYCSQSKAHLLTAMQGSTSFSLSSHPS